MNSSENIRLALKPPGLSKLSEEQPINLSPNVQQQLTSCGWPRDCHIDGSEDAGVDSLPISGD